MSRFMWVLGILLAVAGVAIFLLAFYNNAYLQVRGLQISSAIDLIIGAVLAVGLAGVISAVQGMGQVTASSSSVAYDEAEPLAAAPAPVQEPAVAEPAVKDTASKSMRFPSFSRKVDVPAPPVAAAATAAEATSMAAAENVPEVVSPAVKETISALEQAKSDLEAALAGPEETAEAAAGELYVVEDKVVRGHPARMLSDGTVEAETEEGWMRFENLEHLDEYLDAVEQA